MRDTSKQDPTIVWINSVSAYPPCVFLTCLEDKPHTHIACPTCGAVRYGAFSCPTCREFWNVHKMNEQQGVLKEADERRATTQNACYGKLAQSVEQQAVLKGADEKAASGIEETDEER